MSRTPTEAIREWAKDRGLEKGDPHKQVIKLMEEVGELSGAILRQKGFEVVDGIGDVYVVLTILAMQLGFSVESCIDYAYDQIKNRKGETVNGVFIKKDGKN